ncbi:MAG: hypothetical protein Q9165_007685 [Trypethelium subeluteriae]
MSHKIPLNDLHQHSLQYICSYLDRYGEDGTYTDVEIDAFMHEMNRDEASDESSLPAPDDPWFDIDQLKTIYTYAERAYSECVFGHSVSEIFKKITLRNPIKKCVCIGLGQPSSEFLTWEIDGVPESLEDLRYLKENNFSRAAKMERLKPRLLNGETRSSLPLSQLAAFIWMGRQCKLSQVDVSDHTSAKFPQHYVPRNGVRLYAQDPLLNETDIALLKSLNISVLRNPQAFEELDENTLVYAPHFAPHMWLPGLTGTSAPIVIGNDIRSRIHRNLERGAHFSYERTPKGLRVAEVLDNIEPHQRRTLAGFLDSHRCELAKTDENFDQAFTETMIYWKP